MKHTLRLLLLSTLALATACGNSAGGAATVNGGNGTGGGTDAGSADAGTTGGDDAGGTQADTTSANPGADKCAADTDCTSGVCVAGYCGTSCATLSDCSAGQICALDAKSRLVCTTPAFSKHIGVLCGHNGICKDNLECLGRAYSAQAYCTTACKADVDCPSAFECVDVPTKGKMCIERAFCGACQHDAQCPTGGTCMKMKTGSFCTSPCSQGGTECPRFATCQDVGGGNFQCVHTAGTCVGEGNLCDPCNTIKTGQCKGGQCLQYNHTKESFCSESCTTSCPANYNCVQVSASGAKGCVPADKKNPKCVSKLHPQYEVGSILHDFAMVGMVDVDGDGSLVGEEPRIIHLSDFADHHDLILVNLSAVWCSACQTETKDFKVIHNKYSSQGVVLFQIMYDGQKPGQLMTLPLLKAWNKQLKPIGAVGMDPNRTVGPWNTGGSTPLNMLIDAKTRKVLWKHNGYSFQALSKAVQTYLGK